MSKTFTLTGRSSVLSATFFPPIELSEGRNYYLGLIDFEAYNSVPNVDETNNSFYFGSEVVTIPTGSYEIEDIDSYLKSKLGNKEISIKANNNTLQCVLTASKEVDFSKPNTLGPLLGFSQSKLKAYTEHVSDKPVDIVRLNVILIDCNIISGAYINEKEEHIIYQFAPVTSPGYKIVEVPHNVVYLPVNKKLINNITLRLTDQEGRLLNFRGETVTIRLHLKEDGVGVQQI